MAWYVATGEEMESVADAIRAKGGTSADLTFPTGFVSAINNIVIPLQGFGMCTVVNLVGGASGPTSSSGTDTKTILTETLDPAYVYLINPRRYKRSDPTSQSSDYTGTATAFWEVYYHNGTNWTTKSSGTSPDWATRSLTGNTLKVTLKAAYKYYVDCTGFKVAKIRPNT